VLAFVPLLVVAWGLWRRVAVAAGLALAAFVAASPFALVHLGEAAGDVRRGLDDALSGDASALWAFASLWDALGPALVVAAAGAVAAAAARERADRALLAFVAVYLVVLLPLGTDADRWVLPLVPALGVLAGRLRAFAPVTLLLLIVPLTWTVRDTRELTARPPETAVQIPSRP
jgi:hypothetical protein